MFSKILLSVLINMALLSCSKSKTSENVVPQPFSDTIELSDMKRLNAALAAAEPGKVIIMADGIWNNAEINFSAKATKSRPVTLKAKTPGKVILSETSKLVFSKPYLIADGLFFTEGSVEGNSVIEFKSDFCRLTNTAIVDYNPAVKENGYYWVFFDGSNNQVDHCFFKGKNNYQPLVGNNQDNSRYNSVSYSHFKDIPYYDQNGREIFRIWGYGRSEETGNDGAYFTIENNFFERAHGEGSEIISLKSNRNIVRGNTIIDTKGGITGRSGNFNTIEGNFVFGNNESGSSGIRLAGQGHRVVDNYISDVAGDGLNIMCGEFIDSALTPQYEPILREGTPLGRVPRYGQVKNGVFENNTILNAGKIGINFGSAYNANPGADQRMLLPENNRIANNIVVKNNGGMGIYITVASKKPPLDKFTFAPNVLKGNICFGAANSKEDGIIETDPKLSLENGYYRPRPGSPAEGKGIQAGINKKPLSANDIGPEWVIGSRKKGSKEF